MYLIDVKTGEKVEAIIEPVSAKDLKVIKSDAAFIFDWNKYKGKEIYKLSVLNEEKIEGLMCIFDHVAEETNAIEIELLEVREENIGNKKKLDRIAGCLIAFACRESIKRGHDGYFFLIPKTELIEHYQSKYHLSYMGPMGMNLAGVMIGEEKISRKLIKKYLE
jgi:hypothetical protein